MTHPATKASLEYLTPTPAQETFRALCERFKPKMTDEQSTTTENQRITVEQLRNERNLNPDTVCGEMIPASTVLAIYNDLSATHASEMNRLDSAHREHIASLKLQIAQLEG